MPTFQHKGIKASFPDQAVGLSVSKLLCNLGNFHFKVSPEARGQLFSLRSTNYVLELEIADGEVHFRRNTFVASKAIGEVRHFYQLLCSWKPDQFQLATMLDGEVGGSDACVTVKTPNIFVPLELHQWAREFNLVARSSYASAEEFLSILTECFQHVRQNIVDTNAFSLFWDYRKSDSGHSKSAPKREPQVVAGIEALLRDQSVLLGYELSREAVAGSGNLDLKATATLQAGGLVNVAIEAKNAHSSDIEHGIQLQLPAYMRSISARYGIYLVLWYKCAEFPEPPVSSMDLTWKLTKERPQEGISVELFDLTRPTSPSKLRHETT